MRLYFLYPTFLAVLALSDPALAARTPSNSVLLTSVKTLTLRKDAKTSHRRVSAIPQLKCIGGNGRGLYEIDVMRCKNQGSAYDDDNVEWTCTASLPEEFKLGATDVICEGYDSPQDPYILKGSCGVEYRLLLTGKGEQKHGKGGGSVFDGFKKGLDWNAFLFWLIFLGVAGWIIYSAWLAYQGAPMARRLPRNRPGGFWGGGWGGGGGGGGGNDPYDPPPPYPGYPRGKPTTSRAAPGVGQAGWRPGFWTGALGGAAAGYMAGNRGNRQQQMPPQRSGWFGDNNANGWGARPSTRATPRSSSSSSSSSRYESTGFGSTSRR